LILYYSYEIEHIVLDKAFPVACPAHRNFVMCNATMHKMQSNEDFINTMARNVYNVLYVMHHKSVTRM